jgi:hypothetical protein
MDRRKTVFFIFVSGSADAHSSGVETLLSWSAATRRTKSASFQETSRCRTDPPFKGRGLDWSSFLNNAKAGNSRVCSREFPQFPEQCLQPTTDHFSSGIRVLAPEWDAAWAWA